MILGPFVPAPLRLIYDTFAPLYVYQWLLIHWSSRYEHVMHTDAARPSLTAVSGTHLFQVGFAHLPMSAWSGVTVSLRPHPARRRSNRRHLQSSSSSQLVIWRTRLSTVGDRAFPVAGSRLWNRRRLSSNAVFRNRLKTHPFSRLLPFKLFSVSIFCTLCIVVV